MSKESMKLALEALEHVIYWDNEKPEWEYAHAAITALREALAAQQEPVAWMTKTGSVWKTKEDETDQPLYTSPPAQRAWVELTDREIDELWMSHHDDFGNPLSATGYERAIEAKLKEKNNG